MDSWALDALRKIRVNTAFIGTNGISIERGFTTTDPAEAAVKRAMAAAAKRVVVVADHTKFGDEEFVRFASLTDVDQLITDNRLTKGDLMSLVGAVLQVVTA